MSQDAIGHLFKLRDDIDLPLRTIKRLYAAGKLSELEYTKLYLSIFDLFVRIDSTILLNSHNNSINLSAEVNSRILDVMSVKLDRSDKFIDLILSEGLKAVGRKQIPWYRRAFPFLWHRRTPAE